MSFMRYKASGPLLLGLLAFLADFVWSITLPICSETEVLQRQLCKINGTFTNYPYIIQPYLNIQEVLELNENSKYLTVSVYTHLSWNDSNVRYEGKSSYKDE